MWVRYRDRPLSDGVLAHGSTLGATGKGRVAPGKAASRIAPYTRGVIRSSARSRIAACGKTEREVRRIDELHGIGPIPELIEMASNWPLF